MLEWDDALSMNIAEIDEQHKKLIALMKSLFEAMRAGTSSADLKPFLKAIIDFMGVHFNTEENLLELHGFPGLANHRNEHNKIALQAAYFRQESESGIEIFSSAIIDFLGDLLINHISKTDREYALYLTNKGVK